MAENEELQSEYVPVIFSETDSMMTEDTSVKDIISSTEAAFSTNSKYLNQLKEHSNDFTWKEVNEREYEPIKNSFQTRVSKEISDERVAKEMLRLFSETKWEEMEGNE